MLQYIIVAVLPIYTCNNKSSVYHVLVSDSYRGRASRQWLTDYAAGPRGEAGILYIG